MWKRLHGPTWLVALAVYGGWLLVTYEHRALPLPILAILGGFLVAWHGSLQHETIHGHPGKRWMATLLGAPPLALWLPYELYRESHRRHHATTELTDPERDPESLFCTPAAWARMGPWQRKLFVAQTTALGRLTVGPFLIVGRFFREELALVIRDGRRRRIWALHALAVGAVLFWVSEIAGMPLWKYLVAFVLPGTSLTLLRSLAEHRADPERARRTTVVEAGWLFRLLYLNNNFHVMHHAAPHVPWFELPALWRRERARILAEGSHVIHQGGYLAIVRAHAVNPISSCVAQPSAPLAPLAPAEASPR